MKADKTEARIKRLMADIESTENAELIDTSIRLLKIVEVKAILEMFLAKTLDDFNAGRQDCQNGVYNTSSRRANPIGIKTPYDMGWKQENQRMKQEFGGACNDMVYVIFKSCTKFMKVKEIFGDDKRFTGEDL